MKLSKDNATKPRGTRARISWVRRMLIWILVIVFWLAYFWSRETP